MDLSGEGSEGADCHTCCVTNGWQDYSKYATLSADEIYRDLTRCINLDELVSFESFRTSLMCILFASTFSITFVNSYLAK